MYESILDILDVVLATCSPQIAILIEVALQVPIDSRGKCEQPDVKLSLLVQQRTLAVLLNDVGSLLAGDHVVLNDLSDLGQLSADSDPAPTVRILAGFYDPEVFAHGWVFLEVRVLIRGVISFFEFTELTVSQSFFYMVSQWQVIESVLLSGFVIDLHVVVDSFLVRKVEVAILMICRPQRVRSDVLFFRLIFTNFVIFVETQSSGRDSRAEGLH